MIRLMLTQTFPGSMQRHIYQGEKFQELTKKISPRKGDYAG
ncbi:hypothetical protein CSC35_3619 [Enterobacter hormaechei]|nr:hypothetical protein CSC35_3619 [Enterobacter hormaechei]